MAVKVILEYNSKKEGLILLIVGSAQDIVGLKKIGRIVALTIKMMKKSVRAGMTTKELDNIGGRCLRLHGAVSSPKKIYNFPGETCISLNQEVAHGIPGETVIKPGDLINIDVCAEKNGYIADSGHSFQIPPHSLDVSRLCQYSHQTMMKVIGSLKHGVKLNEIGRLIQEEAKLGGYKVVNNLCSHGVGRHIHEDPKEIVPFYDKHEKRKLKEGLVITIEPFLSTNAEYVVQHSDGWTLCVPDHSLVAQHEHTIIITKNKPIILTEF